MTAATLDRCAAARKLWDLQAELTRLAADLADAQAADGMLARTLGDDGEYFEPHAADFAKLVRSVALRLDRCVSWRRSNTRTAHRGLSCPITVP